jgi:hypothetical protein
LTADQRQREQSRQSTNHSPASLQASAPAVPCGGMILAIVK